MPQPPRPPGLIQRFREKHQARHYARRTVSTDEQWLRRFLRFITCATHERWAARR